MAEKTRKEKSIKNFCFGMIFLAIRIIFFFIIRTTVIFDLGLEAFSVGSVFHEIIALLALSELGIGSAIVFHLYKPLAVEDYETVGKLLALYRKVFYTLAVFILLVGLALMPFVPKFVNNVTSLSPEYLRLLFFICITCSAASYINSYQVTLLNADQKSFVYSVAESICFTVFTTLIIISAKVTKSYMMHTALCGIQTYCTNLICAIYVKKNYPEIRYDKELSREEKKELIVDIKNICGKKICGFIKSSTDGILISTLVDTLKVGLYNNYKSLYSLVYKLTSVIFRSTNGSIGNLMATEDNEKCISLVYKMTFMYFFIGSIFCNVFICSVDTVIHFWLGVSFKLDITSVVASVWLVFLDVTKTSVCQFLEASGLFKADRNISVIGAVINLVLSIILGIYWGIAGIIGASCISSLYELILKGKTLFNDRFCKSSKQFIYYVLKLLLCYTAQFSLCFLFCCLRHNGYDVTDICIKIGMSLFVAPFFILVFYRKTEEYLYLYHMINGAINSMRRNIKG